ncbi:MAG: hypothetical protein HRT47_01290 [Candidatus Caenarcaniphilales bacterium]|nr:hypothetical protein [Candidatus Caenarcaniphilales bacterium]
MANTTVTTANTPGTAVKQDVNAANKVVGFKRVTPVNSEEQAKVASAEEARKTGQDLASSPDSLNEKLESGEWKVVDGLEELEELEKDGVLDSIEAAEEELMTPDDGNVKLDKDATGFWGNSVKNISGAFTGLVSTITGIFGDVVPAAKQLVEKTPTKKGNKLATHLGLAGAGLVGLSSLDHLVKAIISFAGRKDSQVPGLYYLVESLAQGGFSASIFKEAFAEGQLNIKQNAYKAAGLLGLKVGENIIDGTAPQILDPIGGNIVKEFAEGVKWAGSSGQGGGEAQAAPVS